MSVVAIGQAVVLGGYALAGVEVLETTDAESVRAAWHRLPEGVELVLLTPGARAALGARLHLDDMLWVEVPE